MDEHGVKETGAPERSRRGGLGAVRFWEGRYAVGGLTTIAVFLGYLPGKQANSVRQQLREFN
ncbi:MAG: hypothetical protein ACYDBJ_22495 [Aggregatilineales bacterium]